LAIRRKIKKRRKIKEIKKSFENIIINKFFKKGEYYE